MATLIVDRALEARIKAERESTGASQHDEVWDGVTIVAPLANDEHQELVILIAGAFLDLIQRAGRGQVRAGTNLSDRAAGWTENYREPDVAVILNGSAAVNHGTHWQGAVDFLVEVVSPDDRSRDKLPFYGSLGVREVLIVDRDPWMLELYRLGAGQLRSAGRSSQVQPDVLASAVLPVTFQLIPGALRPGILITHATDGRTWTV